MRIIAAVFIDTIQLREAPGPSTRIDLGGREVLRGRARPGCPSPSNPTSSCSCTARRTTRAKPRSRSRTPATATLVARNVQMLAVEPGKFNYRLVRAELTFEDYGTVEASCRIDVDDPVVVPYTLLPPVEA